MSSSWCGSSSSFGRSAMLAVAFAVTRAVTSALSANARAQEVWRGLPARALAGVTLAILLSLPGDRSRGGPTTPLRRATTEMTGSALSRLSTRRRVR